MEADAISQHFDDKPVEDILGFLEAWETLTSRVDTLPIYAAALAALPVEERERWLRGKRGRLAQNRAAAIAGSYRARSTAYSDKKMYAVAIALEGHVDINQGWRDKVTGRRVKTFVRELSRIPWDLSSSEDVEVLVDVYVNDCREAVDVDAVRMLVNLILAACRDQAE